MGRWKERDAAASVVVGEIILVAVAIVGASVVYVLASRDGPPPTSVEAVSFSPNGHDGDVRTLVVAAATDGLAWERLELSAGRETLAYDAALSAANTWCRVEGSACAPAPSGSVLAGQELRLRHAGDGSFEVRDVEANGLLWRGTLQR